MNDERTDGFISVTEIDVKTGIATSVSEQELKDRLRNSYFTWLSEVGSKLNYSKEQTALLIQDANWFGCFDDGLSPDEAISEARQNGVV